jgi:hypothetical protein
MTMARAQGTGREALRITMAALCLMVLASCTDGYPTEDVPQSDPAQMTQPQLLAALDALGEETRLGKRWRYALRADCELVVSARNGASERRRIVLDGAEVSIRSVDGISEIKLVPNARGEAQAVTVLETRKWSDTVLAKSLLTHLEMSCGMPDAPAR